MKCIESNANASALLPNNLDIFSIILAKMSRLFYGFVTGFVVEGIIVAQINDKASYPFTVTPEGVSPPRKVSSTTARADPLCTDSWWLLTVTTKFNRLASQVREFYYIVTARRAA